jgi:hypothetical protein
MDDSKTPIFDVMARNLSSLLPKYQNVILCPICMKPFSRAELSLLTKDHVLARALGGKKQVLTCKKCNNEAGHKAQGHLSKLFKINEGFSGTGDFLGKLTVFEETIPATIRVMPGSGLAFTARGGHPTTLAKIDDGFRNRRSTKWKVEAKVPYSPGKASAAIARAAYLSAFHEFGYEYALSDGPSLFRAEVVSAMDEHSDRLCVLTGKWGAGLTANESTPESLIIPTQLDGGLKFLLAMLRFRQNRDYWMFCALPNETQPPETLFPDLADAVQRISKFRLHMDGDESGRISVGFVPRTD